MAEEDAFLVDYVEGGLCIDNIDARIVGRCNSGSNKNKGKDSLESKYMAEDSSSNKFLVSNFNNYKMVNSRPVIEQYNELLRILGQYTQHSLKMDESNYVSSIIDKLPPSWKDFKHTLRHGKDDLSLVQLGRHLRIEESLRAQDSDKGKGKEVGGPSVNMTEEGGKNKHHKQNRGKNGPMRTTVVLVLTRNQSWNVGSVARLVTSKRIVVVVKRTTQMLVVRERGLRTNPKCGKTGHFKKDCRSGKKNNANAGGSGKGSKDQSQDYVYMSSSTVVNSSLWHARLGHVHYKRMLEMSKHDLIPAINEHPEKCTTYDASRFYYVYLLHAKDEALDKFRIYKTEVELQQNELIKTLHTDRGGKYYDPIFFQFVEIIHETTAPYTSQQNGVAKRKNRAFKEMVNSMLSYLESRDVIFDANRFSSIPRLNDIIPNSNESQMDVHSDDVPSEIPEPRKAMQSRDVAFWKEAIDDEIGFIMKNNTWVLSDLPPGCKPLGCKWIFKRKMKVDGTIEKFKARLVIQGFGQKGGVIHQMDEKTTYLNANLEEEVYMKQLEGFVMLDNEHKVCKLVKSLYRLKQAPKQWHQKFDEVVLSSGFHLNQSDKCVYSKIDDSGKGVIICLYVDDMLIFGIDQNQVDKTKKFLSSSFSMKDMGEADVILGIKIKRENKGIVITVTQSHYIEKILKKFNHEDCYPVSTTIDPIEKLKPNTGKHVDQLEYSRAIGCLMYVMTSTRPDIAFVVGRLSKFTKLEGYSNASWISHVEDSSSTSGWVFLLGGGAISWASKNQTCITGSTIESEFVALVVAGKETE
nr:hypothetical protein [Tanacetum cinerariifolium]